MKGRLTSKSVALYSQLRPVRASHEIEDRFSPPASISCGPISNPRLYLGIVRQYFFNWHGEFFGAETVYAIDSCGTCRQSSMMV